MLMEVYQTREPFLFLTNDEKSTDIHKRKKNERNFIVIYYLIFLSEETFSRFLDFAIENRRKVLKIF